MKLTALALAAIIAATAARACDHTIVLSNWKSCAIGQLSQDGGEAADWKAVPAWTKRSQFGSDPRLLANHGLCNAKFHRVVFCFAGFEERVSAKDECWYQICAGVQARRIRSQ